MEKRTTMEGDKVLFVADKVNGAFTVMRFEAAKQALKGIGIGEKPDRAHSFHRR